MIEEMNKRIKNLTVWDIGLTKLAVFCFTVALVKIFPVIMVPRIRYWVILLVLLAIKPAYRFIANK